MKRQYLEEDLQLITKYFPGAKAVTLRTPFDLTMSDERTRRQAEDIAGYAPADHWYGGLLWTRS